MNKYVFIVVFFPVLALDENFHCSFAMASTMAAKPAYVSSTVGLI